MNDQTQDTIVKAGTPEVIAGSLKLQLSKLGLQYECTLQKANDIKFSKETINQDYEPLKKLRELSTAIADLENPYTKFWSDWNKARKSIADPIVLALAEKTAAFTKMAEEIKRENDKLEAERVRIKGIKDAINAFTVDFAGKIAAATDNDTLIAIQMRIGTEKSHKVKWGEFIADFFEACKGLESSLKIQKSKIAELKKLEDSEKTADDAQLMEIMEMKETIVAEIEQGKIDVQEITVRAATSATETVVPESLSLAPKARRTAKKWRVDNLTLLYKKRPDLVDLIPNKEKIDAMLDERRKAKVFIEETTSDGITFYEEKSY